jgi:hypothetical protein
MAVHALLSNVGTCARWLCSAAGSLVACQTGCLQSVDASLYVCSALLCIAWCSTARQHAEVPTALLLWPTISD